MNHVQALSQAISDNLHFRNFLRLPLLSRLEIEKQCKLVVWLRCGSIVCWLRVQRPTSNVNIKVQL